MSKSQEPQPRSDREKLDRLLRFLRVRLRKLDFADEEADAGVAVLSLMHAMVEQASVVLAVADQPFAGATTANVRALFEAWAEIRMICGHGDRRENGIRFATYGALELREFFRSQSTPRDELKPIDVRLEELRQRDPDLVASVEADHVAGRFKAPFWSNMPREKMMKIIGAMGGETRHILATHRMLAMESHHIATAVLRAGLEMDGPDLRLHIGEPAHDGEDLCGWAEVLVRDAWTTATQALRIAPQPGDPEVVPPASESPEQEGG